MSLNLAPCALNVFDDVLYGFWQFLGPVVLKEIVPCVLMLFVFMSLCMKNCVCRVYFLKLLKPLNWHSVLYSFVIFVITSFNFRYCSICFAFISHSNFHAGIVAGCRWPFVPISVMLECELLWNMCVYSEREFITHLCAKSHGIL